VKLYARKSLKLKKADWMLLDTIAGKLGALYRGLPSWRVLVRRIAAGELHVGKGRLSAGKATSATVPAAAVLDGDQ